MELEDVRKLANLARIEMNEEEIKGIAKDFSSILAYVGQIKEASTSSNHMEQDHAPDDYFLNNIMREDIIKNNRGENTEKIMKEMPNTQDGYLKVKQIL